MDDLKIFTGRAHPELAKKVCDYLGLPVGRAIIGNFPDGEISCKIDEDIRGRDVFIIQPTCPPVNDNLMELLIMVDSCMRASADRITAVMPYFGYARQDRKDEGRVPITAKLVANMIARAGTSRVLAMDLHAAQIQGFFDIPVDHLYAAPVIDDHIKLMNFSDDELVVVSPDEGSIKRALAHMARSGGHPGHHRQASQQRGKDETGPRHRQPDRGPRGPDLRRHDQHRQFDLRGRDDDANRGARKVYLAATHGLLVGGAIERIQKAQIDGLFLTDTIPISEEKRIPQLTVLSVAPLLGEAIKRIHRNESVSRLFG